MPRRSEPDADAIDALADALHAAALDGRPGAWTEAMEQVADAFGADSAYLQPAGGRISWGPGGLVAARVDPSWPRSYIEHYGALDPVLPVAIPKLRPGEATVGRSAIDRTALWRTEFGHDWCQPQGMHDTMFGLIEPGAPGPGSGWGLVLLTRRRGVRDFERGDMARFEVLLPHVRRAVATCLRLSGAFAQRDTLSAALDLLAPRGAILVDARGRAVFASRAAESILAAPDAPLRLAADGTLHTPDRAPARLEAELRRLLAGAAGGSIRLACAAPDATGGRAARPAARPFTLQVLKFPGNGAGLAASALVLVDPPSSRCPAPSVDACRAAFGLTPAEAEAARLLAETGPGAKALARSLGVSPATARTHLQRIFDKTGAHTQAGVVALLRGLGPLV